ncbi:MAG: LAGLIDADG family homing endonuclease [Candidatus Pacebacteria bacterium]|nr:LAGLIDADG family homing endonuclease [Candidatus Paceibacterota bacterium]
MTELSIYKKSERAVFPKGAQRSFLIVAQKSSGIAWRSLASKLNISERTLTDWKKEKYSLPLKALNRISRLSGIKAPTDIKTKGPYWYAKKAGEIGGKKVFEKYGHVGGDPNKRKMAWRDWWNKEGKLNLNINFKPQKIKIPQKSPGLAEFVGIMIGDGGMSDHQIHIASNYVTDNHYIDFVKNLIKKLFELNASVYRRKNSKCAVIVASRVNLVKFCKSIGIKTGNKLKQNLDIPAWIRSNKKFRAPCIRGLMDTDGCIYLECHKTNKKKYYYPRLSFVSHSENLRGSVYKILLGLGFNPKIRNNRSVQIEDRQEIIRYFKTIKTNNLKHLDRFNKFFGGVG